MTVLKKKYDVLQQQLANNESRKNKKGSSLATLKRVNELESSFQNALREKEDAKSDLLILRQRLSKMEGDVNELKRDKDALQHSNEMRDVRIIELENSLKSAQENHKVDKEELLQWRKKCATADQEINNHKSSINRLQNQNKTSEQRISELKEDLEDAEARIKMLENALADQDDNDSDSRYRDYLLAESKIAELEAALKAATEGRSLAEKEVQRLKNEVWHLEDDLKMAKVKIGQLQQLLEETNKVNDDLKKEIADLKKRSWDAVQNYDSLEKELNDNKYKMELLQKEHQDLEDEFDKLRRDLSDVRAQKERAIVEKSDLKVQMSKLQAQYEALRSDHEELKDENEGLRRDIQQLRDEIARLKHELDNQPAPIQVANVESVESSPFDFDELDGARRDRDKLQVEKDAAENRLKGFQDDLMQKQREKDRAEDNIKDLRMHLTRLETDNKNLETAKDKALYERDLANQKFVEQRTDNESLRQENESLTLEIKELRDEINEKERELRGLAKRRSDLEKQLSRSDEKDGTIENMRRKYQDRENQLQKEIVELQRKFADVNNSVKTAEDKAQDADAMRNDADNRYALLREDMINLQSTMSQLEIDLQKERNVVDRQKDEIDDLLKKLGDVSNTSRAGGKEMSGLEAELDALNKKNQRLADQNSAKEREIDQLNEQLNEYRDRLDKGHGDLEIHLKNMGDKGEIYRKDALEKANFIEKLRAERVQDEIEIENLKAEIKSIRSELSDNDKDIDQYESTVTRLNGEKIKLENDIIELTNKYKLQLADLENDNDIRNDKIRYLEDILKRYERQIQELRESQASYDPSSSTTLIFDVDQTKTRKTSRFVSYTDSMIEPEKRSLYRIGSEGSGIDRPPSEQNGSVEDPFQKTDSKNRKESAVASDDKESERKTSSLTRYPKRPTRESSTYNLDQDNPLTSTKLEDDRNRREGRKSTSSRDREGECKQQ